MQFFTETLIISVIGGAIGLLLGLSTGFAVSVFAGTSFPMPWMAIIAALITVIVVTLFSGSYPAVKASKLDPVEALRYE
jgi:putative ABC transport system permease protein